MSHPPPPRQLTIWDASPWATPDPAMGGHIPANYTLQPFSFEARSFKFGNTCDYTTMQPNRKRHPCTRFDPSLPSQPYDIPLSQKQVKWMAYIRQNYLAYSNILQCGPRYSNDCTSSPPPPPHPSPPPP